MKLKLLMDDIEKDGFFGPILRGTLSAASYHIFPSVWFRTIANFFPNYFIQMSTQLNSKKVGSHMST